MALLEFRESSGAGSARGGSQGRGGGVGHHGKMRLRLTWEMDIPMCHSQTIRWIRAGIDLKWLVDWNTGFFKKKSQPSTGKKTEIPCLPPQPPTSMLWSEVPSCFFWRPPNTKFRRQHWIGGRGDMTSVWPLWCGTVLHGMAVFFEELGMFGWDWQMLGWIYQAFQTVAFEKSHPLCLAINWILSTMGSTLIPMCNYPHSGMSSNQCFQVQAPKDDPLLKLLSSTFLTPDFFAPWAEQLRQMPPVLKKPAAKIAEPDAEPEETKVRRGLYFNNGSVDWKNWVYNHWIFGTYFWTRPYFGRGSGLPWVGHKNSICINLPTILFED